MGGVIMGAVFWELLCLTCALSFAQVAGGKELTCQVTGSCLWNITILSGVNDNTTPTTEDCLMHLMARETDTKNRKKKARLKSPVLLSSPDCKVALEQELHGEATQMVVKQVKAENGFPIRQLVLRGSNVDGKQERQYLKLYYPEPTVVLIEGMVKEDGILALKSANFDENCNFHDSSSRSTCDDDEYSCFFTNICIKQEKVCDFFKDCPEGDDETQCGITDFENGMAGWYESANYDPPYNWRWVAAQDAPYNSGTAPDHDHTVGSSGHFMWAAGITAPESPATAVAEAPLVGPTMASCTVSFWYQRKGEDPDLRFVLNTDDSYFLTDIYLPDTNDLEWHEMKIEIGAYKKVSLEFISNWHKQDGEYNDVCVDDVDMIYCSSDTPPFEDEIRCNFNDNNEICRLYQSHDENADWKMTKDPFIPEDGFMKTSYRGGIQTLQTWWYSKGGSFCVSFRFYQCAVCKLIYSSRKDADTCLAGHSEPSTPEVEVGTGVPTSFLDVSFGAHGGRRDLMWTEARTIRLIECVRDAYGRLTGRSERREIVWRDIFAIISQEPCLFVGLPLIKMPHVTREQCMKKWQNLRQAFLKYEENKKTTGAARQEPPIGYDLLCSFLSERPIVNPETVSFGIPKDTASGFSKGLQGFLPLEKQLAISLARHLQPHPGTSGLRTATPEPQPSTSGEIFGAHSPFSSGDQSWSLPRTSPSVTTEPQPSTSMAASPDPPAQPGCSVPVLSIEEGGSSRRKEKRIRPLTRNEREAGRERTIVSAIREHTECFQRVAADIGATQRQLQQSLEKFDKRQEELLAIERERLHLLREHLKK